MGSRRLLTTVSGMVGLKSSSHVGENRAGWNLLINMFEENVENSWFHVTVRSLHICSVCRSRIEAHLACRKTYWENSLSTMFKHFNPIVPRPNICKLFKSQNTQTDVWTEWGSVIYEITGGVVSGSLLKDRSHLRHSNLIHGRPWFTRVVKLKGKQVLIWLPQGT